MRRLTLPLALLAATPAFAHHPMGGEAPATLAQGLLSGLAHPVIGIDHLAFVVLAGLAAAAAGRGLAGPAAFVAATLAGTLLTVAGATPSFLEIAVAGSVVVLGALLALGRRVAGPAALAGFALAGVFHGLAYGEAVIGSETGAVLAYLAGFGVIQLAIAAGVAALAGRAEGAGARLAPRLAAAVCLGIGLAFLVESLEGMVFA